MKSLGTVVQRDEGGDLERADCGLCGADDVLPVLESYDVRRSVPGRFSVVRCRRCSLVYVNPRPSATSIARYYPPEYAPHRTGPCTFPQKLYYRLFRIPPVKAGSRVLDVGCGGGSYLLFLRDRGYSVAGVEPNRRVAAYLREQFALEVYGGALTDAALPAESFDAVTFWWVIEHTHDPLAVLREARRVLRPGGSLVVAVQNFASLGRRIFGDWWHHLDVPGHLYQFEPATLRAALAAAGFRLERLRCDLLAKDFAPSVGYRLGLERSLDWWLPNLLAVPFDLLSWSIRRSGLITAYATRA